MEKQLELLKIYTQNRNKHLKLPPSGDIYYMDVTKGKPKLRDSMLLDHLNHKYSIGAIPFEDRTSFVGIDFDYKGDKIDWDILDEYARKSIQILGDLGIPKESIIVSKSGMKGIHVDFLFDCMQWTDRVKALLDYVKIQLELPSNLDIDKRGCNQSGYKLPLGLHFKTGEFCSILDVNTFVSIIDFDKWYSGHKLVTDSVWQLVLRNIPNGKLGNKVISNSTRLSKGGVIQQDTVTWQTPLSSKEEILKVIELKQLISKGSRNNIMFKVGLICKDKGMTQEDIFDLGATILYNTPEEYFSDRTSIDWKFSEWAKELDNIFIKKKPYYQGEKTVSISVELLKEILSLKRFNLMQTAFLHYCMSQFKQRYNLGRFYSEKLLDMKSDAIYNNFNELISNGWIRVVDKGNNLDGIITASTYEFTKEIPVSKEETLLKEMKLQEDEESIPNFTDCVMELLTDKEVKSLVTPTMFQTYFSKRPIKMSMRNILQSITEV